MSLPDKGQPSLCCSSPCCWSTAQATGRMWEVTLLWVWDEGGLCRSTVVCLGLSRPAAHHFCLFGCSACWSYTHAFPQLLITPHFSELLVIAPGSSQAGRCLCYLLTAVTLKSHLSAGLSDSSSRLSAPRFLPSFLPSHLAAQALCGANLGSVLQDADAAHAEHSARAWRENADPRR